jgi:Rnl2 family RNA ligase
MSAYLEERQLPPFHSFRRINNVNPAYEPDCAKEQFVVTEKIHGSNFSVWLSPPDPTGTISYSAANRTGFLQQSRLKKFFRSDVVLAKYWPHIEAARKQSSAPWLVLVGELFGGWYEKQTAPDAFKVQSTVEYCPTNEFFLFDIQEIDKNGKLRSLGFEEFEQRATQAEFPLYAKAQFQGDLIECLNWSRDHNADFTTVSPVVGCESRTIREGHVIRSVHPTKFDSFVMLKDKNAKFSEKKSETDIFLRPPSERLASYLTQARVDSVRSKYETDIPTDELVKHICKDAAEDLFKQEKILVTWKAIEQECRRML